MTTTRVPVINSYTVRISFYSLLLVWFLPTLVSSLGYTLSSTKTTVRLSVNNGTMVSPGEIFELGLFKAERSYEERDRWYLGIWFKRFPKVVVWVANRDDPMSTSTGIIKLSNDNLIYFDQSGGLVWETNLTEKSHQLVAELLDNGNFVLRHSNKSNTDGFLWQSFDYPTDTLLPGMKLGWSFGAEQRLTSWNHDDDPSSGYYTYKIEEETETRNDLVESMIWDNSGLAQSRIDPSYAKIYLTTDSNEKMSYALRVSTNASSYAALRLTFEGVLIWWVWTWTAGEKILWKSTVDGCDEFGVCGSNSYCLMNIVRSCTTIPGFLPRYYLSLDFVRRSPLNCNDDELHKLSNMKLPITTHTMVDNAKGLEECKKRCLEHCNCTAVAFMDMPNGGSGCVMWTGDLYELRSYNTNGQDVYVKVALADIGQEKNTKNVKNKIIGFTVGVCGLIFLCSVMFFFLKKRNKRTKRTTASLVSQEKIQNPLKQIIGDWKSTVIEFEIIARATNNFSETNIIGKGGFGIVYKGEHEGQEIAVKRLLKMSNQGIEGFDNEVSIIAVTQHVNLVRLIGYFSNHQEKILVYEFLENSSLDTYLFDSNRRSILSWEKRFAITKGIARGLLYLHQDSRFRIIHLDLKPSNILLGKDLIPKISDFGMAKILNGDDTEAEARTLAGTFGYMSPEYARYHVYSVKSDVFSFGVLLLEIVSGNRNSEFARLNNGENLLRYIWSIWSEGKGLEIVDQVIKDSSSAFPPDQVQRCIQIGLLCVQELPEDRPTMSSVVLMLGSETEDISKPKPPYEIGSSSIEQPDSRSYTVAQITMSEIEAR